MPGLNPAMVVAANAMQAAMAYAQLHSAAAGGSGTSNVTTAPRRPIPWGTVTGDGDFGLASPLQFTGGTSNGLVYSVTLWSASSGGTYYAEFVLTGDAQFNSLGQYTVTAITLDGSATWLGQQGFGDDRAGAKAVWVPNPRNRVYPLLRIIRQAANGSAIQQGALVVTSDGGAGANVDIILPNPGNRPYPLLRTIRQAVGR